MTDVKGREMMCEVFVYDEEFRNIANMEFAAIYWFTKIIILIIMSIRCFKVDLTIDVFKVINQSRIS